MSIAENIAAVKAQIAGALQAAGRTDEVHLVAVTKYSAPEDVLEAARAGLTVFAENRVQMLMDKWRAFEEMREAGEELPEMHWHLIGHLQTNKVKYIVGKVELIHSCDSLKLAQEISKQSVKAGVTSHILIEVNVSGEESKSGVPLEEAETLVREAAELPGIFVDGLMTMAPKDAPVEIQEKIFGQLHEKFVDIGKKSIYNASMNTLSMGMSSDLVSAIKCGATHVRVGRSIFH